MLILSLGCQDDLCSTSTSGSESKSALLLPTAGVAPSCAFSCYQAHRPSLSASRSAPPASLYTALSHKHTLPLRSCIEDCVGCALRGR